MESQSYLATLLVIGGGNAWNTVAARLALDHANYSVALIEAGSFYEILSGNKTQIPGYNYEAANPSNNANNQLLTQVLHAIETEPIPGYNGRSIGYTTGVTFGGSTAANYGGYARATAGSHDLWVNVVKDDFWSWDNVYPFYKKSVNFSPPDYTKIDPTLNITYDETATIAGAVDPRTATRSSSETSFLQAAAGKTGLKIYPNTLAKRILFDGDKKATGVEVEGSSLTSDFSWVISARKEVIVSAGVWRSPQILMVSGVGPANTLSEHGIDLVVDIPAVGQNAWDQPFMAHVYKVNVETNSQIVAGNSKVVAEVTEEYLNHQSGHLSSIGAGGALGFEKYPASLHGEVLSESTVSFLSTFPEDWPDTNYLPLESSAVPNDIGPNDIYLLYGSTLFSTSARGNVTIRSADTADDPLVSPNWLGDEGDVEMASSWVPAANVTTREQIVDWVRNNSALTYHGACTCKMGADDDADSVVDTRTRVRGVTGLRIVDASAFAILPPGYPMAVVYMFAEKIADAILTDN
ncbi:oxidoreductase [Xylaria cubensis]|nr:oxidoreductase [Xylaria cubensis]